MEDIVRQAMAKWPNVPHCYGWLALDARGQWRMRDARAQQLNLAGDKLSHQALLGFIARNYDCDGRGCWYFQNGPQRVYVNLEATPYIARSDPQQGWLLQTGAALGQPERVFLSEAGELLLCRDGIVAQLDDRDMAAAMALLQLDGAAVEDAALLDWLEGGDGELCLLAGGQRLPVRRVASAGLARQFGFVRLPQPEQEA